MKLHEDWGTTRRSHLIDNCLSVWLTKYDVQVA